MYGTLLKGPRYLEMAEGYVTGIALSAEDEIIGYQFVNFGKMTDFLLKKVMIQTQHGRNPKASMVEFQTQLGLSIQEQNRRY